MKMRNLNAALALTLLLATVTSAVPAEEASDPNQVRKVLEDYVVGWRDGDVDRLASVFAVKEGRVTWVAEESGSEVLRSMTFEKVLERMKPHPQYGLKWEVLSLDVVDSSLAVAKVRISHKASNYYIDYLVLEKIAGEWRIVSKTFVYHR